MLEGRDIALSFENEKRKAVDMGSWHITRLRSRQPRHTGIKRRLILV